MQKTILLTGATDGIGLATAKLLVAAGHHVLLHGRSAHKLQDVAGTLGSITNGGPVETFQADLSRMTDVEAFAKAVTKRHATLDVLINNAGVLKARDVVTQDGFDVRFAVNTLAPYLLTKRLLPLLDSTGRIINLSSAAQASVNANALAGRAELADMDAYAQSKLAITMWSRRMAMSLRDNGPAVIAVNPGSLLASKMVKDGFGVAGKDIGIGAGILVRAALTDEFATASGQYFDNDSGHFAAPHPDALDERKTEAVVRVIEHCLPSLSDTA